MGSFHSKCFSERAYSKRNVCYLFSPGTWAEYQTIRQGDLEKVRLLTMTTDWAQLLSCPQTASSFHFKARTGALPPTHPPTYHHHTTCHPISPQQLLHKMKVYT